MRILALVLSAAAAFAQAPPPANSAPPSSLAIVRFQVAPQKGKPATDLRAEDIEIREDGNPRKVAVLQGGTSSPREIPIEVSLVFDCNRLALSSGTLNPRLFQESLLDEFPDVSVAIYGFAPGLNRLAAPTRNSEELLKALESPLLVHPLSTFLMDHISRVMVDTASSPGAAVRMVVVVSTGQTDQGSSSATDQQERYQRAVAIAQQANLAAFPVVLTGPLALQDSTPTAAAQPRGRTQGPQVSSSGIDSATIMRNVGNFGNLGAATGGRKIEVLTSGNMLPAVLKQIADEIRTAYVAGFEVPSSGDKKRHKVEVVIRNKDRGRVSSPALTLIY